MKTTIQDFFSKLMLISRITAWILWLFILFFLKNEKCVANLHEKKEYAIPIRNLKQGLKYGSVLKKVHRVIKFNQKAWLESYIDMNTKLRKMQKYFEKDFFKLMNDAVIRKKCRECEKTEMWSL